MQNNDAAAWRELGDRRSLDWGELFAVMDYAGALPEVKAQQPKEVAQ